MSAVVTRVDPPLIVNTPFGTGLAHWRIERGIELPTYYEVWLTHGERSGQIWEFPQHLLRAQMSLTANRQKTSDAEERTRHSE